MTEPRPVDVDAPRMQRFAALGMVCLCVALGGASTSKTASQIREERQKRLDRMTGEQRDVLKVQFERWKSLPDAEKDRWRDFDAQLDADHRRILESYVNWLGTLTHSQREELRRIDNPVQRALKVVELKKVQGGRDQFKLPRYKRRVDEHLLSPEDFEKAVEAAWDVYRENRPEGEAAPRFGEPNPQDTLSKASLLLVGLGRALLLGGGKGVGGKVIEAAQQAIEDPKLKSELAKTADPRRRQYRTYLLLARTLAAEIAERIPDGTTPEGKARLEEFFSTLPPDQQDHLLGDRPEEFWTSLEWRFGAQHNVPFVSPAVILVLKSQDWNGDWPRWAGGWFDFQKNRWPQNWNRGGQFRGGNRPMGGQFGNPPPERREPPPPRDGDDRPPPRDGDDRPRNDGDRPPKGRD